MSVPAPVVKKDSLMLGLGVVMIAFGLVWGVLLGVDDAASILAGCLSMIAGVAMVLQSSRTMLYAALSLSAGAGVVYLFSSYGSDFIGSILSFATLTAVYSRRGVFKPAPQPQTPAYMPPTYPPPIVVPSPQPPEAHPQPQPSPSMYCPSCGNTMSSSSRFCPFCGRDVYRLLYETQTRESYRFHS